MYIDLSKYPSPPKTGVADFPKMDGGLNLEELPYRIRANESPAMKNLWWEDGVLQCRAGQMFLSEEEKGVGYACCPTLFFDRAFFHIGDRIYWGDPEDDGFHLEELVSGVPENRGTFFRYLDWLFYKNRGGFYKISYAPERDPAFSVTNVAEEAYVPVLLLNVDPDYGSGDTYQPENRLSPKKTVRYNAKDGVKVYHLPATDIDGVSEVRVDGVVQGASAYTVDKAAGTVTFTAAPPVTTPATNNTVEITYSKANNDAYDSIMDCTCAFVAGGDTNICILLAGCPAQPNAVFWNDRDNLSMNPTYFPMTYYNLVGDTLDPVTGFGRQYSDTIVLKEHAVGKLGFGVESQNVDGRNSISFTYTNINNKVGCDLPGSIQLIENNLVFCNTYQGVHILRSSSAAYENNVECISRKVNGGGSAGPDDPDAPGLLKDVQAGDITVSHDDDTRYWLCANGHAYVWDYTVSTYSDPSWFYQTNIAPVGFFSGLTHRSYHLDRLGRVTRFGRYFHDYGGPIDKEYQFPVLSFGTYDRLKDVTDVVLVTRSDTETQIRIQYITDYDTRDDLTDVFTWDWTSLNMDLEGAILGYFNMSAPRFARVARRRPGCRHVRHFTMVLKNDAAGQDLALVSAQIYYRMQGKER